MRFGIFVPALVFITLSGGMVQAQSQHQVSYTPLSEAARKSGQLSRYDSVPVSRGRIEVGGHILEYSVPRRMRAYDVVPVKYKLSRPAGDRRSAVEAVAFEDRAKARGRSLYDLAIPGNLSVDIEYLGSICADLDEDGYIPLTADPKTPVSPYPPFKRDEMVRTSNIREARAVWFKFRITNTGDTILDPEGIGASFSEPVLRKFDKDGKEEWTAQPVNQRDRQLEYIYPGESVDQWVCFFAPRIGGGFHRGLREGEYRVDFRMLYRYYREYHWGINIWTGKEFAVLEVPITVTKAGGNAPVNAALRITDRDEKMPGYFDAFEEFMTSFRIYPGSDEVDEQDGVIYLQVAPWTSDIVLKLILTDPKEMATARIPVRVTTETLRIKYNPDNEMVVTENGREEPIIVSQAMDAMRIGSHIGPFPEEHMREHIREMKDLGVNVIANTSGSWWIPEVNGRTGVELHSADYKYWYDVLMREYGLKVVGWSVYPPSSMTWYRNVTPLLGREIDFSTTDSGYVPWEQHSVDMGDPIVPEVIAAWTVYNHQRWGDYWFKTRDGRIPVDIEDTWGWMRDDINRRYIIGPLALKRFQDWAKKKYETIAAANEAWGSDYKSFDEINPEKDQGIEGDNLPHGPVYNKKDHPFHDWSPATEDWDVFRTELRMEIYRKANEIIRKTIPGAELALRTEGANLVMRGDGKSDNMHWRHVYYSQRRNAMVFDVVKEADVLHFYSDYTTLPYSEADWRQGMREMVAAGVIPMFLPQFDHMRDILLNPHYGREYEMHYNLDAPSKGMMIHCLTAAYPWWKATYEEGGAPGILWSDYLCDGFATETQKRELRLLRNFFNRMIR